MIGLATGLAFVIWENNKHAFSLKKTGQAWHLVLHKDTFFFSRVALIALLEKVPEKSRLIVDANAASFIDEDVIEMLNEFRVKALERDIEVKIEGLARPEFMTR